MIANIFMKYARLPHGGIAFYQQWIPKDPHAVVIYLHGLGDHVGRYHHFVSRLMQAGCACMLFDQRGHGFSSGKRGHIDTFKDWIDDVASFVQFSRASVPSETPLFLVGSCLGALIGINYLLTHASPVAGMVTLNAALKPAFPIPAWKRRLGAKLYRFAPELSFRTGIRFESLTQDELMLQELKADPLVHRRITVNAAREIFRNMDLIGGLPQRVYIPMLMLAGGDDQLWDPEGTVWFAKRLTSIEKQYAVYPDMRHDMLHDVGRERVMDNIVGWILERAYRAERGSAQYHLNQREALWENVS